MYGVDTRYGGGKGVAGEALVVFVLVHMCLYPVATSRDYVVAVVPVVRGALPSLMGKSPTCTVLPQHAFLPICPTLLTTLPW